MTGTVRGVGFTGTLLRSLEDTVSGTGPAVLKLQRFFTSGRHIYNFLACFLAFGLPAVPSLQICLQESPSPLNLLLLSSTVGCETRLPNWLELSR